MRWFPHSPAGGFKTNLQAVEYGSIYSFRRRFLQLPITPCENTSVSYLSDILFQLEGSAFHAEVPFTAAAELLQRCRSTYFAACAATVESPSAQVALVAGCRDCCCTLSSKGPPYSGRPSRISLKRELKLVASLMQLFIWSGKVSNWKHMGVSFSTVPFVGLC